MCKKDNYRETDKMSDLIRENYPMLLVMSRFGIPLGFGDKNIREVCSANHVDTCTLLAIVNFLLQGNTSAVPAEERCLSIESLISYLHNSHDYFLKFRLPHIRIKLMEAIGSSTEDVMFVIRRFFDEYVEEVNKHMHYEEKTVFPYVRSLLAGEKGMKYKIAIFMKRHDQIELKIAELKNILIKYYPGATNYMLNSVLYDIFTTEEDLASHNRIEDSLFIPAILEIEKADQ